MESGGSPPLRAPPVSNLPPRRTVGEECPPKWRAQHLVPPMGTLVHGTHTTWNHDRTDSSSYGAIPKRGTSSPSGSTHTQLASRPLARHRLQPIKGTPLHSDLNAADDECRNNPAVTPLDQYERLRRRSFKRVQGSRSMQIRQAGQSDKLPRQYCTKSCRTRPHLRRNTAISSSDVRVLNRRTYFRSFRRRKNQTFASPGSPRRMLKG